MKKIVLPALLVWFASGLAGFAQMGPSSPPGMSAALTKLFGTTTAFSAKCDVRVLDKSQKEKMALPMDFALLDGRFRAEIDMTQMKGQELDAGTAAQMKQMGMDRIVSIMRPDKKALYLIYPGLQSYVNMPLPKEDADALAKEPKIERTVLGKETIGEHACEKAKVVITDASGKRSEATVWTAKYLNDFPVQIQMTEKDDTVILRYSNFDCRITYTDEKGTNRELHSKDAAKFKSLMAQLNEKSTAATEDNPVVEFLKPDSKLFEAPAGFTAYNDMQSFMTGMMQKMMGGMNRP